MRKAAIVLLALAMIAAPVLAAGAADNAEGKSRSLLETNKADKADHGGWGGHGSGHWDTIPHGDHHDLVWHDTSHGGWGHKLMSADKADKTQEADAAQHGGRGGYGGWGGGHGSGHWDYVPHGDHHHAVWHDTSYRGWGRKLMSADKADKTQEADAAQHGGWGGYGGWGGGHGSGHWDYVPHGDHHDAVWHDTSYGGWGRK